MANDMLQTVRDLVRRRDRAALATTLPASAAAPRARGAWPYASLVLTAVDHDLSPILLLSDLAEHSKAIGADDRVSLLFDGTEGFGQPLTGPRVSLLGLAVRTEDERLHRRFLARHPDAVGYAGFKDFHFYRVAVDRAHLVAGFGRIRWLEAAELTVAPLPGLADAEARIVEHMNNDHADALQLYASKLLGLSGDGWRMTGIDAEGIDLRQDGRVARLAFDAPLASVNEVRGALVALAVKARAA